MRIVGLSVLSIFLLGSLQSCKEEAAPAAPPPAVLTYTVTPHTVPVYSEWVGQTRGCVNVEIRARVEGFLDAIRYNEGEFVRKGQVMYTIDPLQYEAQLNQQKGLLAESEANLAKARQDVVRYKPLVEENAISREEYETALSMQDAQMASVEAAKGSVSKARLDLGYCNVIAPIDGLAGKSEIQMGNLVGRGQNTLLTTVSKIDPIRVRFSLSEQELIKYRRSHKPGEARMMELFMVLADGSVHPYQGKLVLADNAVDAQTGTLLLEAEFPNPDLFVRPGQFARVRAIVQRKQNAIVIPQRAVTELQGEARVVVVKNGKAEFRNVVLGPRVGATYIVEAGLQSGEQIILEGIQKVRDGVPVRTTEKNVSIDSLLNRN